MWFRLLILLLVTFASTARAQYQAWAVSWLQHAYSAQAGRDYMGITNFVAGSNVSFTITSRNGVPYVTIGVTAAINPNITNIANQYYVLKSGDTMTGQLVITNGNAFGNIVLWADSVAEISFRLTNGYIGNFTYELNGFNLYDNLLVTGGDVATDGIFYGDGSGLSNVVATTTGLSVTQNVVFWSGSVSNLVAYTNVYQGGLLVASGQSAGPAHGASLIQPGGGYLLQPGGGTILLP